MTPVSEPLAIEGIRRFLKLHATCGGAALDTPDLPRGTGYRVVAACRCGDTAEYWLTDTVLPRHHLVSALTDPPFA
jgi:hypothetical protein